MPKGPQGQKRPADAIGRAVAVARIATGEVEDTKRDPAKDYTRKGGVAGGKSRAKNLSDKRLSAIARKGAKARWKLA